MRKHESERKKRWSLSGINDRMKNIEISGVVKFYVCDWSKARKLMPCGLRDGGQTS